MIFIHHPANAAFSVFSLIATFVILTVFPFDFSEIVGDWLNVLIRLCLIIGIVGAAISEKEKRSAWARLLSKIYEVHAFVCPKCSSDMRVIAVIMDPIEIRTILRHLVKTGRSPPGLNHSCLN